MNRAFDQLRPVKAKRRFTRQAAASVGLIHGQAVLDLDYHQDQDAAVDRNVVMTGQGKFVEIQGTGEEVMLSRLHRPPLIIPYHQTHPVPPLLQIPVGSS